MESLPEVCDGCYYLPATTCKIVILKDITLSTPAENILYDEVLLRRADAGEAGPVLRLWESDSVFIVLGKIGKPEEELCLSFVREDGIPVLRRSSGGGTVVQGPGCLNFSLVLAKDEDTRLNDLRLSYRVILESIVAALGHVGVRAQFYPTCDLALIDSDKKISGNAQRRGRRFILHHGTILYNFDLSLISRYLAMPKDIPDYRQGRAHEAFVANADVTKDELRQALLTQFHVTDRTVSLTSAEAAMIKQQCAQHSPQICLSSESM